MKNVPTKPITSPAFKKALGMARIPVPKLPFSKWISVSVFLREEKVVAHYQPSCLHRFNYLLSTPNITIIQSMFVQLCMVHVFNFMSYFIKNIKLTSHRAIEYCLIPPRHLPPGAFETYKGIAVSYRITFYNSFLSWSISVCYDIYLHITEA